MKKSKLVVVYEYGTLAENSKCQKDETGLSSKAFKNLWNYALCVKENSFDDIMSAKISKGHEVIKLKNYVGTIQTKDGTVIEILPKVYGTFGNETDKTQKEVHAEKCRKLFLKMLKTVREYNAKSFSNAALRTKNNFPILESYIKNYLLEAERVLLRGVKSNYESVEENQKFLKGKLLVSKNIQKNLVKKTKFFVRHSKYIKDIPQNRILLSTVNLLSSLTQSGENQKIIKRIKSLLSEIPESTNIAADIEKSRNASRLFCEYENLMNWSAEFLQKKGFTNFSGEHVNIALLFPAEKLFESYIAYLFKKHSRDYVTSAQHSKYYLVEKHSLPCKKNKRLFRLKPDMFLESVNRDAKGESKKIIIDTKWKNLDENKTSENYLIDIKDIYQLYAYGQKYKNEDNGKITPPHLALIYPKTQKHTGNIKPFFYDDGAFPLILNVFAFDLLCDDDSVGRTAESEVRRILNELK